MGGTAGVGSAHLVANNFVSSLQNPFAKTMSAIFDPIAKAQAAGSLTYDDANKALQQFNEQWSAFDTGAEEYKKQGGKYKDVVEQAYDANGDFMKTVENVRKSLTDWTTSLKPADAPKKDDTATTPPTMKSILDPLGTTPADAARSAAVRQGKRNMSAPGFSSTLLGGASGAPTTKKPTLLGY